jgi:hypothetical protein
MAKDDLESIYITSGVNEKFKGFCTVSINGGDMLGQLSPPEVRRMAYDWLEAAEAAETDAIVCQLLSEMDLPEQVIGGFLIAMRNKRPEVSRETED